MRGSEARPDVLPAAGVHNLDKIMLTNSLSTTRVGQCRYTPGRGGGRRAAPFKDLRPPGPSGGRALCALSHQRQCVSSPAPVVVSSAGSGDHDIRYFH